MNKGIFTTGAQERYLEDFIEGAVHEFGPVAVTEKEITEFGRKFDPVKNSGCG
jgi:hypothetical protein